ncbi:hypothetical protein LJC27_08155 [Christensenellaceae bacterium OttesenSCG-928-M15]|nr:hypothetical protein [Christensenellaceae bacterium OttesenSCG-928-M15]
MRNKFENTGFARLYLWTTKAKYTMGMFFLVFVLAYLLFGLINGGPAVTLDFFTAVQMMFASFFIGIAQQAIIPGDKLTKARCAWWIVTGVCTTLAFSLLFGWFSPFPPWCAAVFFAVLIVGMLAMILGYFIELRRETRVLNQRLAQFQKQPARETNA